MPDPRSMITEQYNLAQRQLTEEFDQMRHLLGQQNLEPEEHEKAYAKMLMQFQQRSDSLFHRNESQAQLFDQLDELAESGVMPQEEAQKVSWGIAGLPAEQIRAMFPKERRMDWVTEYNKNRSVIDNMQKFIGQFSVQDPWFAKPRLEFADPVTKKSRKATEQEKIEYQRIQSALNNRIRYHFDVIIPNLTTNQRTAGTGRNAMLSQTAQPRTSNRIRVQAPNGKTGTIEANEWETYKAQGFRRIK